MTNALEKTFFDTFEIKNNMCKYAKYGYDGTEGTWYFCDKNQKECWTYPSNTACKDKTTSYPEITDHILLELILIIMHHEDLSGHSTNIQELKDNTLKQLIETYNKFSTCVTYDGEYQQMAMDIKQQVHELFKEGTNDR